MPLEEAVEREPEIILPVLAIEPEDGFAARPEDAVDFTYCFFHVRHMVDDSGAVNNVKCVILERKLFSVGCPQVRFQLRAPESFFRCLDCGFREVNARAETAALRELQQVGADSDANLEDLFIWVLLEFRDLVHVREEDTIPFPRDLIPILFCPVLFLRVPALREAGLPVLL